MTDALSMPEISRKKGNTKIISHKTKNIKNIFLAFYLFMLYYVVNAEKTTTSKMCIMF